MAKYLFVKECPDTDKINEAAHESFSGSSVIQQTLRRQFMSTRTLIQLTCVCYTGICFLLWPSTLMLCLSCVWVNPRLEKSGPFLWSLNQHALMHILTHKSTHFYRQNTHGHTHRDTIKLKNGVCPLLLTPSCVWHWLYTYANSPPFHCQCNGWGETSN